MRDIVDAHQIGVRSWVYLLQDWMDGYGVTEQEVLDCKNAVEEIEEIMRNFLKVSCVICGSHAESSVHTLGTQCTNCKAPEDHHEYKEGLIDA